MKVETLFPRCHLQDCAEGPGTHHHILPKQRLLLDSTEQIVAQIGGYGSSKTLAACVLGHLLSVHVPGNMGIVVRRSLPKLRDNTQRIFLEVLDRSGIRWEAREVRDGWPGRVIYPDSASEVLFRESTDLGRFLGPEYGWGLVDEAQEEPEKSAKDLLGRLRLPRASKHLKLMFCSNPPTRGHWLQKWFPRPGSWEKVTDVGGRAIRITYRMIHSKTSENPFLDPEYIARLKQTHTPEELERVLSGEYGQEHPGKPVYRPPFAPTIHVGDFKVLPIGICRSWDFGFHHPAVTFSQMYRCPRGRTHCTFLRDLMLEDLEAKELARRVLEFCAQHFPDHHRYLFVDAGDAAGAQVSDRGPGPIIELAKPPFNLQFKYSHVRDVDPGIRYIRDLLRTRCECGHPLLEFDREADDTIQAMLGGYRYPKDRYGVPKPNAKPLKDGYYEHVADSVRYAIWNLYRPASQDEGFLTELERWQGPTPEDRGEVDPATFRWMDWGPTESSETLTEAHTEAIMVGRRIPPDA